jgi:hypothetical protein
VGSDVEVILKNLRRVRDLLDQRARVVELDIAALERVNEARAATVYLIDEVGALLRKEAS